MSDKRSDEFDALRQQKESLRARAKRSRQRQKHKESLSRRICDRLAALDEFVRADRVLIYVGSSAEVQTKPFLSTMLTQSKEVIVPCCVGDELALFRIESVDELAPRTMGIFEPCEQVLCNAERKVEPAALDLLIVPGVAFDRCGGRLGYGRGFFDRLLCRVESETPIIGLAFECQLFDEVPMMPHDVPMDKLVTEADVYCRG
jgi:5-formyltetrahydrofolate cyclo-ligase